MKKLEECKEWYKDLFITWLEYQDEEDEIRLNHLRETLEFIYGEYEVDAAEKKWIQEAKKEYYTELERR